ncbi:MAG: phosphodiesterase [Firmicutes bacterium]|nr:phosphodiesterase [Bacillota bacterium]
MKLMFISDIHGIKTNLNILNNYQCDKIIFLGDLYDNGYFNNPEVDDEAVKQFILSNRDKIVCVKGNCDSEYDYKKLNIPVVSDYLKLEDNNLNIYCTHGHRYNFHNLSYLGTEGVIIYGHEHVPYIEKVNDIIYICVGSISRPRFGSEASFCIYENHTFTIYSVSGEIIDSITI